MTDLKDLFFKGLKKPFQESELDRVINIVKEYRTTFQLLEGELDVVLPKFSFMDNAVEWPSLSSEALKQKASSKRFFV